MRVREEKRSVVRGALGWVLVLGLGVVCAAGCTRNRSTGAGTAEGGRLTIKGSDTMVHLVTAWAEAYHSRHPDAKIAVTGGGSGTGIKALINGTTDLCMASRKVKPTEREQAAARGIEIRETVVCLDGIAVIVHPDNPVSALDLDQLRAIFTGKATRWSEVGGPDEPITVLSRESNSGTYVFFRDHVLGGQDYTDRARLMPATAAIVQAVRQDRWSVGYVGLGYLKGGGVKPLAIRKDKGSEAVAPSVATVRSGRYPLSRPLHLVSNGEPKGLAAAFLAFCLSDDGQRIALESGYVPLRDVPAH